MGKGWHDGKLSAGILCQFCDKMKKFRQIKWCIWCLFRQIIRWNFAYFSSRNENANLIKIVEIFSAKEKKKDNILHVSHFMLDSIIPSVLKSIHSIQIQRINYVLNASESNNSTIVYDFVMVSIDIDLFLFFECIKCGITIICSSFCFSSKECIQ